MVREQVLMHRSAGNGSGAKAATMVVNVSLVEERRRIWVR